jgi:hypothetical protein
LRRLLLRWARWFTGRDAEEQFYIVGYGLCLWATARFVLHGTHDGWRMLNTAMIPLFLGLAIPVQRIYERLWPNWAFRVFVVGLVAFGTNRALGMSRQAVSQVTGVEPCDFALSSSFGALLYSPSVVAMIVAVCSIVGGIFVALPWLTGRLVRSGLGVAELRAEMCTLSIRLITFVFMVVWAVGNLTSSAYETGVERMIASRLWEYELYGTVPAPMGRIARSARLSDGRTLVGLRGTEGVVEFSVRDRTP